MSRRTLFILSLLLSFFMQGCAFNNTPTPQPTKTKSKKTKYKHIVKRKKLDKIVKKIVKAESTTGNYHTVNRSSGAYGRYQILPKTAKHYSKKLKIKPGKWKLPRNQDKIFFALLQDNIKQLKQKGYKINAFTVYGCHQQGVHGFDKIMKNKRLDRYMCYKLKRNLPNSYLKKTKHKNVRDAWIRYWSRKMS